MKVKVLITEFTPGHDECLYSVCQHYLRQGAEVVVATNSRLKERVETLLGSLPIERLYLSFRNGIKGLSAYSQFHSLLLEGDFTHLYINTAQCSITWMYFMLHRIPRSIRVEGTLHGIDRLSELGQRFITRRIDRYVLLAECLLPAYKKMLPNKDVLVMRQSNYPLLSDSEECIKAENELWITIPGSLELKRRDYEALLHEVCSHRSLLAASRKLRFVLLGNASQGDGPEIQHFIEEHALKDHFLTFSERPAYAHFYSVIRQSDYIMPLCHDASYWTKKISGAYNLAWGHSKTMILPEAMRQVADFHKGNLFYQESMLLDTLLPQIISPCISEHRAKLAVIGASYLQLPLVRRAKEMGLEVHCFAWEEGAVCRNEADYFYSISIVEKEEILRECQRIGINGICTIASDVAVPTVSYVAQIMGLAGNPYEYAADCTNKYSMRRVFMEHNLPSPRFYLVPGEVPANMSYPLIVKPTDRSGSRGVERVDDASQLEQAIVRAMEETFSGQVIVEEYVEGREISVETISYEGQHYVLQITDKVTTGAPHFVELEHHQPSSLPLDVQDRIRTIVPKALDALHVRCGASHSELKVTPQADICIIEIGARMGGDFIGSHLVRLSTGYDYVKGVIDVALDRFVPPQITEHRYAGVYFLAQPTAHILPFIQHPEQHSAIVEAEVLDSELHPLSSSADRSGYLIYSANEPTKII